MPFFEPRAFRVLTTIFAYLIALALIYYARYALIAFLLALLFAFLLEPLVAWLQRLRLSRGWAITVVYAGLLILLGYFFIEVGPPLVRQAELLGREIPVFTRELANGELIRRLGIAHGWSAETQHEITRVIATHQGDIARFERDIAGYAASFVKDLWWIILIPIISVFYLVSGRRLGRDLINIAMVRRRRRFLSELFADLHQVLAYFIRAQLILMLIAIVVYVVFLTVVGMPDAVAIGFTAGVLEFIPTLGPILAAVLILGAGFLLGYAHWIILPVFLAVWRVVQDYYNSPHIMGHRVKLHPFWVIFAVIIGAELAGVLGVFLSVPILASLRVIWVRWQNFDAGPPLAPPTGDTIVPPPAT